MKLNLASGTDLRDGWLNLDVVPQWPGMDRGCDLLWDARKDRIPCGDGQATEVYAGYLLLHLAPCFHAPVLKEIRRVCNAETRVVFGEVDMERVMARWLHDPMDRRCAELIWGEQGDVHGQALAEFDKHCHGFTLTSLKETLRQAGFSDFRRISVHTADVWWELTVACRSV